MCLGMCSLENKNIIDFVVKLGWSKSRSPWEFKNFYVSGALCYGPRDIGHRKEPAFKLREWKVGLGHIFSYENRTLTTQGCLCRVQDKTYRRGGDCCLVAWAVGLGQVGLGQVGSQMGQLSGKVLLSSLSIKPFVNIETLCHPFIISKLKIFEKCVK